MRTWASRILLVTASVAAGLGAAELGVRWFFRDIADAQFDGDRELKANSYRLSATRGYEMIPNCLPDVNSRGFRDPERDLAKPANGLRVVVLGDSIAFGVGVTLDTTFSALLERRLAERFPGRRVEVFNCGVIGYNTEQQFHTLLEVEGDIRPDAVVLGYCPNDIQTTPVYVQEGDRLRLYIPGNDPLLLSPFLVRHSALYRYVMAQVEIARAKREKAYRQRASLAGTMVEDADRQYEFLRRLARHVKGRSLPFLVVVFPYLKGPFIEYEFAIRDVHGTVARIGAEEGFDVVNLLAAWGKTDYRDWLRPEAPDDFVHPNRAGHEDVARRIDEWLAPRLPSGR